MNELEQYISSVSHLMFKLEPAELKKAIREASGLMRKRNQERIKANISPDGKSFPDRQTDKWKLRKLKDGESLSVRHKFAHMKERNIKLAYVRKESEDQYLGRREGSRELSSFQSKFIRIQRSRSNAHMFRKLLKYRWLKMKVEARQGAIGFMGSYVARMASEHQDGSGRKRLPSRVLLGFNREDIDLIEDVLLKYLDDK